MSWAQESTKGMVIRRYFVPREEIHYLRYLIEGYEGLIVQSSDPGEYVVTWQIPVDLADEAEALARALADEIQLRPAD